MSTETTPTAAYRLQFNAGFTFADARRLVPYLSELGISHVYASPYLMARAGSTHGYDIVDHNSLNSEIGDNSSLDAFVAALHERGMGQILDFVSNHMGVLNDDNTWWLDVLENGPSSDYSGYFDIDWKPLKEELRNKVLLPVLGDQYGNVLESGDLKLQFDREHGAFCVRYYEHGFPIDPGTFPQILEQGLERLDNDPGDQAPMIEELKSIITALKLLPARENTGQTERDHRQREKEVQKRRLAELCRRSPMVLQHVLSAVDFCNGRSGDPPSFDRLHHLLESQAYRLAYWRVAADEINYRRFFDINDLAGLRMEHDPVFTATHQLVLRLFAEGRIDGLRIDHPDGLYDPRGYLNALRDALLRSAQEAGTGPDRAPYLAVEKILASYEHLREDWPVAGTTGYEFAAEVCGVLMDPNGERPLDRIYRRFIDRRIDFDELVYDCKKLIIKVQQSSELTVLANQINRIAQRDRTTRDFTLNGLRDALTEIVACFPVYRTYITPGQVSEEDRKYVEWAVAQAKKRSRAADVGIFDFLQNVLLLEDDATGSPDRQRRCARFVMRFQQYTSPVMAKGLEDTAFYIYNRLLALNEVGADPRRWSLSVPAFHHVNAFRLKHWPGSMLNTCTHDSKRSEDVRARLAVLSEIPDLWRRHLGIWARLNRSRRRELNGSRVPARNDEYFIYQTLLGAWPLEPVTEENMGAFRERMEGCVLKAMREAKVNTSWINPNPEYEQGALEFLRALLRNPGKNAFLADFTPFAAYVARLGLLNSLSQTLLKLTCPGVPDIFQGNELWQFNLVDPDNRRPVDFERRMALLHDMRRETAAGDNPAAYIRKLLEQPVDGRAKLYLIWKVLNFRRNRPDLFSEGSYVALNCDGPRAEEICAYARVLEDSAVVIVAPRWYARRVHDANAELVTGDAWSDTRVLLPPELPTTDFRNLLTSEACATRDRGETKGWQASMLLRNFPVAVIAGTN